MRIDPRTVMVMILIGSSLMGGGLLWATRGYLGQIRGGSRWAKATLLQAAGWTLVGPWRDLAPDFLWVVVGHGLLALSLSVYLTVLAEFTRRPVGPFWVYGVVIIQSVALSGLVMAGQGSPERTVVVATASGILMAKSAQLLLSGTGLRPASDAFTGVVFGACSAMLLARGLYDLALVAGVAVASEPVEAAANDVTYLVFYATATLLTFGFVLMISDRYMDGQRQAASSLQRAVEDKEALLQEVHHRVKNNLQLILSLTRLEAGQHKAPETQAVLKEMQGRIRSVVLLNETLYKTGSYSSVNLSGYLGQIATHLFSALNADSSRIRLVQALEPVEVATSQAIPCGLIVNELVTNSLKHAFPPGGGGEVTVGLRRTGEGSVRLWVSDTGAGLPADLALKGSQSLGLQLVSDLGKQVKGALEVGPNATFAVTFPPLPAFSPSQGLAGSSGAGKLTAHAAEGDGSTPNY